MTTPRKTARDFDSRLLKIYDGYVHGKVSKREFLTQAGPHYTTQGWLRAA